MFHQMDRSRIDMSGITVTNPNYEDRSQDAGAYPYNGRVLLAAVILLSVIVFFVILLHIYARWFLGRRPGVAHFVVSEPLHTLASLTRHIDREVPYFSKGLDPTLVASLPMFVHEGKEGESGLDCVVCLSVMDEGEIGRVLPRCKHVFHVECIDMWLGSHSTCPICRAQVKGEDGGTVADEGVVVVEVAGDEELGEVNGGVEGSVSVELSTGSNTLSQTMNKDDGSSLSSSSSSSSSFSSSSSSLSCSLMRMVSKNRSESRVFPSENVN